MAIFAMTSIYKQGKKGKLLFIVLELMLNRCLIHLYADRKDTKLMDGTIIMGTSKNCFILISSFILSILMA